MNDDQLKQIVAYMDGQFTDLRDSIKENNAKTASVEHKLESLDSKVSELQQDMTELRGDVAHLQQETTELRGDVAHLQQETTELRGDVAHLQQDMTEVRGDVTHLQRDVTDLRRDMNDRFDLADQVQNEILDAIGHRFEENDARYERHTSQIAQLAKHAGLKLAA